MGFPGGSAGKESARDVGKPRFDPWVGKIPWRRDRLPSMVLWPGELHGLRSPRGHKEPDTTERLALHSAACGPLSPAVTSFLAPARVSRHSHVPHSIPSGAAPLFQLPGPLPSAPASPPRGPHPLPLVSPPFPSFAGACCLLAAPPHLGPCPRLPACSDTSVFSTFQLWVQPLI